MTETPSDYLKASHDRILDELVEFAQIPSVSTDPAHKADVIRAAEWVADQLRSTGAIEPRIMETSGNPVVYGEWLNAPGAPTIIIYGHYDVQPPDPLDKWESEPFRPVIRDGRLYGRGVSDDKGPVLIPLKVAEALFATTGKLPINVKFLIEGEEEIGSPSLEPFLSDNAQMLSADFALSADGAMWRIDEPSVTTASRGMMGLEFGLQGSNKDLHSGRYGGSVANPLHAMARLLASLHTDDGKIAVTGFYEDVVELAGEDKTAITGLPFDEEQYRKQLGASALFGESGYTTLERVWSRPTLEINGMWGGYQGPGSKSVTPSEAHAKITCRLVMNQKPEDIQQKLVKHLQDNIPPGVKLTIQNDDHGALPYRIPSDHIGLQVAERVLSEVYKQKPLFVWMGGTLPVSELFKRILGIDTVFFSFSTADEDYHAPNEFFRIHRLYEGLEAWLLYWNYLGQ